MLHLPQVHLSEAELVTAYNFSPETRKLLTLMLHTAYESKLSHTFSADTQRSLQEEAALHGTILTLETLLSKEL